MAIYIITPHWEYFCYWLNENNFKRNDRNIRFINEPIKLMGCRITNEDEVIYYAEHGFSTKLLNEINMQIEMRKREK